MVRQFLIEAETADTDFERRRRLQDQALATRSRFNAWDRLTREEVHDRALR